MAYRIRFAYETESAVPVTLSLELGMPAFTDRAIERARVRAERALGRPLPVDPQTGFPNFTVLDRGDELGGG